MMLTKLQQQSLILALQNHISALLNLNKSLGNTYEVYVESNELFDKEHGLIIADVSDRFLDEKGHYIDIMCRSLNKEEVSLRVYADDRLAVTIRRLMKITYLI